jgi:hypothetical protein
MPSPLVESCGNLEGHQSVLLLADAQIIQTTGVEMEQGSLREHLPRKKTIGIEIRSDLKMKKT